MKQYVGVKIIKAKPMTRKEAEKHLERNVGGDKTGEGYLVEYDGGYQAWSPKDVFEDAYQETLPDNYVVEFDLEKEYQPHQERVIRCMIMYRDILHDRIKNF